MKKESLLFNDCSHPIQISQAKNIYDHTKDVKCHRCPEKNTIGRPILSPLTFLEKTLLSKIYKIDSVPLEQLERESIERNNS